MMYPMFLSAPAFGVLIDMACQGVNGNKAGSRKQEAGKVMFLSDIINIFIPTYSDHYGRT
jgi:hypothetical protein